MRLVLVHGINHQGQQPDDIKRNWLNLIESGLQRAGATDSAEVRMPFYGDRLAELSGWRPGAIALGAEPGQEELNFLAAALQEQANAAGVTARQISDEARGMSDADVGAAVQQGFPMDRRINAIVRVLERVSPLHGALVMRLLKQAHVYLKQPGAGGQIDAIVRPVLDAGPAVIVSHSLGTVVTFKILRQLALENRPLQVPLYVTLGSPLSLMAVKAALGPDFTLPAGVARWINAVDPDDFIALGRGLDRDSFCEGIDNYLDIQNIEGDAHAIDGYLRDQRVAMDIAGACGF